MKKYTIVAGVNGAGKTTLYNIESYLKNECRVNADEILSDMGGDWRNPADVFAAGKKAVERLNSFIDDGVCFNQETTLCGNTILNSITRAKENGYLISPQLFN